MEYDRVKRCSCCLPVVFCSLGVILILCGSILHSQLSQYKPYVSDNYVVEASLMLSAGCLITLSVCLEVLYWCKDTCGQGWLFILQLSFYVLLLSSGIVAIVHTFDIAKTSDKLMVKELNQYDLEQNPTSAHSLNELQQHLQCCGVYNLTDWANTTWGIGHQGQPPYSCCGQLAATYNSSLPIECDFYTDGCFNIIQENIYKCDVIIATVSFLVIFILFLSPLWSRSCRNQPMDL